MCELENKVAELADRLAEVEEEASKLRGITETLRHGYHDHRVYLHRIEFALNETRKALDMEPIDCFPRNTNL